MECVCVRGGVCVCERRSVCVRGRRFVGCVRVRSGV